MTSQANPPKRVIPNLDRIDPIGEIKTRASELWQQAGSQSTEDWTDYFDEAEKQLMRGRSAESLTATPRSKSEHLDKPIPEPLKALITKSENPLVALLARTFSRFVDEHESLCLGHIFRNNRFQMKDGGTLSADSNQAISEVLAELAQEYPDDMLIQAGVQEFSQLPIKKRSDYWLGRINKLFDDDKPLTFADRNTISRLLDMIVHEGSVAKVIPTFSDS